MKKIADFLFTARNTGFSAIENPKFPTPFRAGIPGFPESRDQQACSGTRGNVGTKIQNPRGFALVIVLAILVLLVGLVVGFLVRASTEKTAASGFRSAALARQLADTAVSLVQGQVNMATGQGPNVAWVSQPGMVRTFSTGGVLSGAYKLYSAPDMISGQVKPGDDLPETTWVNDIAVWTDLNAPITVNGVKNYPILDSDYLKEQKAFGSITPAEGFKLTSAAPGATSYQPAPMPVRWLYVLKDGTLVPSTGSGNTATVSGADDDKKSIVGRIAFWTDDETCKVNVNTAGEGTYWSPPYAEGATERALARFQPAQKEFQRYPGHPAMASFSAALPGLTLEQYMALVPRYSHGGSQGATRVSTTPVSLAIERLYSSLDELMFLPNRTPGNLFQSTTAKGREALESRRFLLTAHSRAPETNLFNLPRIAAWPIYKLSGSTPDPTRTTAFDRTIALCASTGDPNANPPSPLRSYYFQRERALDPTSDISIKRNGELYDYLHYLTGEPIPGFGGAFSGKYPADRDQILTEIFDYIRCTNLYDDLLATGSQFTAKRNAPGQRPDPGHGFVVPTRHPSNGTMGFGRFYTLSEFGIMFICNAAGDNPNTPMPADETGGAPLNGATVGSGQKQIQAIVMLELFSPMLGWTPMQPDMRIEIRNLGQLAVNDGTGDRSLGFSDNVIEYKIEDATTQVYAGRSWGGNPGFRYCLYRNGSPSYPFVGAPIVINNAYRPAGQIPTMKFKGTAPEQPIEIRIFSGPSSQPIQTFRIDLPDTITGTTPPQNIEFPIPDLVNLGTSPAGDGSAATTTPPDWWTFDRRLARVGQNPGQYGTPYAGAFIRAQSYYQKIASPASWHSPSFDVVRTFLPPHGDYRLIAAQQTIDRLNQSAFLPHPDYMSTNIPSAGNLGSNNAVNEQGYDFSGKYLQNVTYWQDYAPDIPRTATQQNLPDITGDFDTGLATACDGPYINKPDEGNTLGLSAGKAPYYDDGWRQAPAGPTFFSPNRQMPSPGMFGSLPTGVKAGTPWQTLLFRRQDSHPQSPASRPGQPADHLIMDLFWMPVVEPYAISDRFSTAGKINMNYKILPFTYIERSTAMRAALKSQQIMAIPTTGAQATGGQTWDRTYKKGNNPNKFRYPVNVDQTLLQFEEKFKQPDPSRNVFKSATEICDQYIVPTSQTLAGMTAFWNNNRLTGDNVRERIYTTLYPLLTTKSNTFTVHFRAQALQKVKGSSPGTWTEGRDVVLGEYRGSTTIERFIEAGNPDIPDYAANPSGISGMETLDKFYKWRVVENRQFAP